MVRCAATAFLDALNAHISGTPQTHNLTTVVLKKGWVKLLDFLTRHLLGYFRTHDRVGVRIPPPPAISKTSGRIEPPEAVFKSSPQDLPEAYLDFKIDLNLRVEVRSEVKF